MTIKQYREGKVKPREKEFAEVLKCIERAFQLQELKAREPGIILEANIYAELLRQFHSKAVFQIEGGAITGNPAFFVQKGKK